MSQCGNCCHWALPLQMRSKRGIEGYLLPMLFQEWLAYHLHVNIHQSPDNWAGELTSTQEAA